MRFPAHILIKLNSAPLFKTKNFLNSQNNSKFTCIPKMTVISLAELQHINPETSRSLKLGTIPQQQEQHTKTHERRRTQAWTSLSTTPWMILSPTNRHTESAQTECDDDETDKTIQTDTEILRQSCISKPQHSF